MLYLNNEVVRNLQPSWKTSIDIIEDAIETWSNGNFSQPLKPYLRFEDPKNRIIAMPAFLGESFHIAGIKWIASFPSNVHRNLPRAHSITLLNDANTGKPLALINSSMISGIRTAAVSGVILREFIKNFSFRKYKIGLSGFGPIGQFHVQMITELLGSSLDSILVYEKSQEMRSQASFCHKDVYVVESWEEAYDNADIFITCTTVSEPYIDKIPKPGSLHLNVSLRDYFSEILKKCAHIIVDDWDEVCRENTDIERTHRKYGLQKKDTLSVKAVLKERYFSNINREKFMNGEFCIFNPMGMALFDIAIAKYYLTKAIELNQGRQLDS